MKNLTNLILRLIIKLKKDQFLKTYYNLNLKKIYLKKILKIYFL